MAANRRREIEDMAHSLLLLQFAYSTLPKQTGPAASKFVGTTPGGCYHS
jgi:hypothetical protein